jgi:hypothetical protein
MEATLDDISKILAGYVPKLLGALAILVVGWLVARIIGALFSGALRRTNLDNRLAQWVAGREAGKAIPMESWVGKTVFYIAMVFVLIAFFEALGLTLPAEPLNRLLNQIFQFAPQLLGAALLLLIAWVLANFLRAVILRVLRAMRIDQRIVEQAGGTAQVSLAQTIADTVYWLIFLLFLPAVLNALALHGLMVPIQDMIDKVLRFLPNIFTATLVLLIGWFLARIVRGIVTNFLAAAGTDALSQRVGLASVLGSQSLSSLVGLVAYILILVPVLIAALEALALDAITRPTSDMLNTILAALPRIFAAALIIIVAYIVGRLISSLITNLLTGSGFNSIFARLGLGQQPSAGQRTPSAIVGDIVLVAILLVAATEAVRQLNFLVLADLINRFLLFASEVILGLIIFGIGLFLANLAASAVRSSGTTQSSLLALATRVSIIVLAGAMALRQMGLAEDIINMAFGLILGAVAVATALAVGLGARRVAGREIEELIRNIKSKGDS